MFWPWSNMDHGYLFTGDLFQALLLSLWTDSCTHSKANRCHCVILFEPRSVKRGFNPLSTGTGFWRPLQTVWIQMRRHRTWRLIRIQTVCYSDSILWKKIEENANFRNLADNILADDKFPSMQRAKAALCMDQECVSALLSNLLTRLPTAYSRV